jgi:hypothetical protein
MIRFYCDRCNAEVEGPDDLIEVAVEGRERPNVAAWTWKSEMCRSCYDTLKEAINNLVGTSDEARRKPNRRAGA